MENNKQEQSKGTKAKDDSLQASKPQQEKTRQEPQTIKQTYESTCELSIRRKFQEAGLPGDDAMTQNPKVGSSFKGKAPLSGLTIDEEKMYLPEIIGISPVDVNWRKEVREYWNNISERVPHDNEGTNSRLPGRLITFTVVFKNNKDKEAFESAELFEAKAEISKRGEVTPDSIADYVLFRYCLVYSRVSNDAKSIHKSAKILFYLYSQETEAKKNYGIFELRNRAREIFVSLLEDISKIDALLRIFGEDPNDTFTYMSEQDKHLKLDEFLAKNPKRFIQYAKDKSLSEKAFIKEAVLANIIHNPPNTDSYYYGDDRQVVLGNSLSDAVLYLKSKEQVNQQVVESIKSQLIYSKT